MNKIRGERFEESFILAITTLKANKFRTALSFLGVSVGIFSIVAILIAIDSLKHNINVGLNSFKSEVVYLQKYPWIPDDDEDGNFRWWDYISRPNVSALEVEFLKENMNTYREIVYMTSFVETAKIGRKYTSNSFVVAQTEGMDRLVDMTLEEGRFLSLLELERGVNAAVIGHNVALELFGSSRACIGKTVRVGGYEIVIVGVTAKQGKSMLAIFDMDNAIHLSYRYALSSFSLGKRDGMIIIEPLDGISEASFMADIRTTLRGKRRLSPTMKDNFSINQMSFLTSNFDELFAMISMLGWIIGGFSLLIGGFGIANIMFVSVQERTKEIGIQKAIGAKRRDILFQYIIEAGVLSLIGGIVGVALVYIPLLLFRDLIPNFVVVLDPLNILTGLLVALVVGLVAGVAPAAKAAKMNAISAIQS